MKKEKSSLLINKKAVKVFTLLKAQNIRGGRFTRVSKDFLFQVDAQLRVWIEKHLEYLPSKGKTI